jgi:hypothetical protein
MLLYDKVAWTGVCHEMHARKWVLNPRRGLYITIFVYDQASVVINNLCFLLQSLHLEDSRVRSKNLTMFILQAGDDTEYSGSETKPH